MFLVYDLQIRPLIFKDIYIYIFKIYLYPIVFNLICENNDAKPGQYFNLHMSELVVYVGTLVKDCLVVIHHNHRFSLAINTFINA